MIFTSLYLFHECLFEYLPLMLMLLAPNDNDTFLVNRDPNFMNGPAEPLKVSRNPPYRVLDILFFHNLISPDKRFDKDLRIFVIIYYFFLLIMIYSNNFFHLQSWS